MKILFVLLLIAISEYTVQQPDILNVNNEEVKMRYMFPLEALELNKRPFGYTHSTAPNTSCWRGYTANWVIIDDKLFLKSINRCYGDDKKTQKL